MDQELQHIQQADDFTRTRFSGQPVEAIASAVSAGGRHGRHR